MFFPPDDLPEVRWMHGDDLCDCTFQRIGEWTNPYIGQTMRVRFCCVWEKFEELYPDLFETIPAYYDGNRDKLVREPAVWDADHDMPRDIWYRQIQSVTGASLDEIREKFRDKEPPKAVKK